MGFLNELTLIQRAGGAAVLVLLLVLLLVKQRQAKGAPAKEPKAAKAKSSRKDKSVKAAKPAKSGRGLTLGRKKGKSEESPEPVTAKVGSGRMVPRLPSPTGGGEFAGLETPTSEFDTAAEPALAEFAPAPAESGAMISEPGWPTPGEVWAAPEGPGAVEDETESWATSDHEDDALAALTTDEPVSEPDWVSDESFDANDGWETTEVAEPVAEQDQAWAAPADEFDWSAPEADEAQVAEPVAEEPVAWDVAGDDEASWATPDSTTWEPSAEEETLVESAPVAVAEVENDTPTIVWDPVDEVEQDEDEPVVEIAPAIDEPADEPVIEFVPVETPVVEYTPAVEEFVVAEAIETPQIEVSEPLELAVASVEVEGSDESTFNPADRWAAMAPGGHVASTSDPVSSWARLRPTAPVESVATVATATIERPQAPVVEAAPSMAWWDVPASMEFDPRRGRFALGGYALQAGHQVVSGVTFREGVVPPPHQWVIGPVVGAVAPGTLVLTVDGALNCRPEDLEVLMEAGFAPTTEGFSLRLAAAAQGPFAASGTYVIS